MKKLLFAFAFILMSGAVSSQSFTYYSIQVYSPEMELMAEFETESTLEVYPDRVVIDNLTTHLFASELKSNYQHGNFESVYTALTEHGYLSINIDEDDIEWDVAVIENRGVTIIYYLEK